MKKIIFNTCFAVALAFILAATANAQLKTEYRGDIPFDFIANDAEFNAGQYTIGPMIGNSGNAPLVIRSVATGKRRIVGLVNAIAPRTVKPEVGHLYFTEIDGRYYLTQAATPTFELRHKRVRTDVRELTRKANPRVVAIAIY